MNSSGRWVILSGTNLFLRQVFDKLRWIVWIFPQRTPRADLSHPYYGHNTSDGTGFWELSAVPRWEMWTWVNPEFSAYFLATNMFSVLKLEKEEETN